MLNKLSAPLAMSICLAVPAAAEDWSACDADPANLASSTFPHLEGSWTAHNNAGHAAMQGGGTTIQVPMPSLPPEPADFILDGDSGLRAVNWASASDTEIEFGITTAGGLQEEAAAFIPGDTGQMSRSDITTVVGCESDLPILTASGEMAQDGAKMQWVGEFIVMSDKQIAGAMKFQMVGPDGRIDGYRMVTFSR